MKFDSNQAWRQAAAQVSANRDLLIALAGVFFLLPSLVLGLLLPQPEPRPEADVAAMVAQAQGYYLAALPLIVPMLLLQAAGSLAMLTLFTDRRRPTVGESIRVGAIGLLPYIAAQLLLGIACGVVAVVVLTLASASGVPAVVAIVAVALLVAVVYVFVQTSLVAPVIAVERARNPVVALRRSWTLIGHNTVRVALFYLLVALGFTVAISVIVAVAGIALSLVLTAALAKPVAAVISAVLGAVMSVYLVAVLAAVHRQLAGPAVGDVRQTFE